ncbi:MAG: indole-3-glycerol-phosphate synthase, partial [Candidatus Bathyarchaeia archaeon]
ITKCGHAPIIAEIKPSSPSHGNLRIIKSVRDIAVAMERGGASGISVLTEPKHFSGSIGLLKEVKHSVNLPVLMKDIIIDPVQIEAASKIGADAILLIFSVFERGYVNYSVHEMIKIAHLKRLEVLLETRGAAEFLSALETEADLVGINNRNLKTLEVDLNVTQQVMSVVGECGKIVVSESGIQNPEDIRFLHACGVKAFLVGSAVMLADNVEGKVRELVHAL